MDKTESIASQFESDLQLVQNTSDLDKLHVKYLGRNGILNDALKTLKDASAETKKTLGTSLNELKNTIEQNINVKRKALLNEKMKMEVLDITYPGKQYPKGSLHLVTYAIDEISSIFKNMGFIRMSYPEVEWDYFSFEALNMPKGHPARDDFETFFIDAPENETYGKMVLTPHTSSGQIREMMRVGKPPIRMINIAKTYRPNWDVTHVPMFHQFEGMCVDTDITISDLKGTIDHFAKEFFGEKRETRLRPFHFSFTEPSFEVDITCGICHGTGAVNGKKCAVCKSGWLELGGSGMVHPNVLRAGHIDPEKYTGWAFGFGVERVMMMKEGLKLDDLRTIYGGDIRFLEQF